MPSWKAADLVVRAAAALFDAEQACGEEANMAKMLASEAAWHAAEACMQTFGGFAFAREYGIERKWRESRLYQTAPISTNLILAYIGQHVLGMPRSYARSKRRRHNAGELDREDIMRCSVIVRGIAALLLSCRRARPRRRRPIRAGRSPSWRPFRPAPPPISSRGCCASRSSEALGQPVVVENRPGAGGTTGAAAVANAAPDGHTLLVTVNAPVTMNVYMQKNFPFDPKTAFAPIVTAADVLMALAVNAALPVKSVAELIDYAKKNADKKLSYGSAGIGSAHHIAGELLKQKTGIDMMHVPYRGGGPAIQDLVAGHIPISFGTTPAVLPQAQRRHHPDPGAGRGEAQPDLPGVPTVAETVPGVVTDDLGRAVRAGRHAEADHRSLEQDRRRRAQAPGHHREAQAAGRHARSAARPRSCGERGKAELAHWGRVIPSIGITPE